nr:MAG TPA: hypothetical protein [Caudoviricetes sp.]
MIIRHTARGGGKEIKKCKNGSTQKRGYQKTKNESLR